MREGYKKLMNALKERASVLGMQNNREILGRFNETILFKYNVDKFKSEDKFISVHMFENSDDVQDDEKDELYAKWIPMVTEGACDPEKAVATPKQVKKTRKSMDDIKIKPKEEKKEAEVEPPIIREPSKADKIMDQVCKEMPDKIEPKPKEKKAMPKSKKEILMEALSALDEGESDGITETQVEEISKRVAVKVFTDLFSEVSETITSTLSSYVEDTKNQ